ncbi:hypothetical protein FE848_00750 [Marinobacter sp. 1-3A]|uniref:hypothetical protein n=1 Tax=Marinobacter sp. 1-3A TaxID=2582920 RepID=UPI0019059E10|nr:hypothetical protein [Marinobacter sp. 1-3A]MBK1871742.1 hypothetical protein [Marinobacter sp. 1-3A]
MAFKNRLLINGILTGCMLMGATATQAEVIFEENFDNQPDWTSGMFSTDTVQRAATHKIPEGWFSIRQVPTWAPSKGHPDKHETIEILASNSEKARGRKGKSFVSWRDSYDAGWNYWASESILLKYFPKGYDELYVEFWISFDPNWTRVAVPSKPSATSKIFRVSSWSGDGTEYGAFSDGNIGPIALWDHTVNRYGLRNTLAFRGGPHSDNYKLTAQDIPDVGRYLISGSLGDFNLNFSGSLSEMGPNKEQPIINDRVNGGLITGGTFGVVGHDQIFGSGASWTKMAFYVKMNSAPGVKDGVFRQWLNDKQIFVSTEIPWIRPSETRDENAKWNLVAIGGNDFFQTYPNEDRHEEWYSIDDLVIRNDIPDYVDSGSSTIVVPPNPPAGFEVK